MNETILATATTVLDPVCGMTIDPATAAGSSKWNGQTYHFCSRSCETKFDAAPNRYAPLDANDAPAGAACCSPGRSCH